MAWGSVFAWGLQECSVKANEKGQVQTWVVTCFLSSIRWDPSSQSSQMFFLLWDPAFKSETLHSPKEARISSSVNTLHLLILKATWNPDLEERTQWILLLFGASWPSPACLWWSTSGALGCLWCLGSINCLRYENYLQTFSPIWSKPFLK